MNAFWEIIASNAAIATIMAIVAMLLGRVWRNAAAIHLLWVVVLLKLFTLPLLIAELPIASTLLTSACGPNSRETALKTPARDESETAASAALTSAGGAITADSRPHTTWNWFEEAVGHKPWSYSAVLAVIWIDGAGCKAAVQAIRIRRFVSVIRDCEPAPSAIRTMVARLSSRLGLRRVPVARMTSRALPPLVWSAGIFPCVILPNSSLAWAAKPRRQSSPTNRSITAAATTWFGYSSSRRARSFGGIPWCRAQAGSCANSKNSAAMAASSRSYRISH